jgi:hypothetical protein
MGAYRLVAVAADPESGRVLPAVDAQLDGVRQQAGHGYRAPPEVRGRGSGPVLADRHGRARCRGVEEPCGGAIAAWPADHTGFLAVGLVCVWLTCARWAGPSGPWTAGAADAVHGDLLHRLAGRGGGKPSRLIPLLAAAALVATRERAQDRPRDCSQESAGRAVLVVAGTPATDRVSGCGARPQPTTWLWSRCRRR